MRLGAIVQKKTLAMPSGPLGDILSKNIEYCSA